MLVKDIGWYNFCGCMVWNDEVFVGSIVFFLEMLIEVLFKDVEVRVSEDGELIVLEEIVLVEKFMLRRMEVDEKGDKIRLDRKLDEMFYFVVKKGREGKWGFLMG